MIPFIILQIGFGGLISFSSWLLAMKAHIVPLIIPNSNMMTLNFLPSELMIEILILIFGIAVIICSNYLRKAHVKLAGWQLIIGVIILVISAALSIGILTLKQGRILGLNYTDILLGLGLILSVLGIIQLILRLTGDLQAVPEQKIIESRTPIRGLRGVLSDSLLVLREIVRMIKIQGKNTKIFGIGSGMMGILSGL